MKLDCLYHWSPASQYPDVSRTGLRPVAPASGKGDPSIAFGFDPAGAWLVCGATPHLSHVPAWDLWQVRLGSNAVVAVESGTGPHLSVVRVTTPVAPDQLWHVGRRHP